MEQSAFFIQFVIFILLAFAVYATAVGISKQTRPETECLPAIVQEAPKKGNEIGSKMKTYKINWLGWAFLTVFAIVAFRGVRVEVCHSGDRSEPVRLRIDSDLYSSLNVKHSGDVHVCPTSGIKFYVDVDDHHKNY